ncbi:MAG: hypothetical protein ABWZ83_01280 [Mesorhizobium sp.]
MAPILAEDTKSGWQLFTRVSLHFSYHLAAATFRLLPQRHLVTLAVHERRGRGRQLVDSTSQRRSVRAFPSIRTSSTKSGPYLPVRLTSQDAEDLLQDAQRNITMSFEDISDPEQLAVLNLVLHDICLAAGIKVQSRASEDTAGLLLHLHKVGCHTADDLRTTFERVVRQAA